MNPRTRLENLDLFKSQNKPLVSEKPYSNQSVPNDVKNDPVFRSLLSENESLKLSLNTETKKKDDLFNVLLKYIEALETAEEKVLLLESNIHQIDSIKQEIEHVKQEIIKRDELIKSLHNQNKILEQTLGKNTKNSNNRINNTQVLCISLEILLQKIQQNPSFNQIFKKSSPHISLSIKSLEKAKVEEICLKLSKFAYELMIEMENYNFRISSPGLTDLKYAPKKVSLSNDYTQSPEKERFKVLNKEISEVLSSSKHVLENNSFSACPSTSQFIKFSPSVSPDNSDVNIKTKSSSKKDIVPRAREGGLYTVKSSRYIPKVEIAHKPSKVIQKILRKN